MGHPLGRWQQVLAAAVVEHGAIGVRAAVEAHLGREATRSEREASRRAAHLLERRGQAKVVYVAVPASVYRRGGTFLVMVRADLDVLDWPDEASLQAIATNPLPLAGPTREALRSTIASIRAAALALDQVKVDTIDRETADQALQAMAEPLRRLGQLQRLLALRRELSRSGWGGGRSSTSGSSAHD